MYTYIYIILYSILYSAALHYRHQHTRRASIVYVHAYAHAARDAMPRDGERQTRRCVRAAPRHRALSLCTLSLCGVFV